MEINLSDAGDPREFLFQHAMTERACISRQQQRDAIVRRMSGKGQAKDPTDECEAKKYVFLHDDLEKQAAYAGRLRRADRLSVRTLGRWNRGNLGLRRRHLPRHHGHQRSGLGVGRCEQDGDGPAERTGQ